MMTLEQNKKRIMRRVYFVWSLRTFFNTFTLKLSLMALFFWQMTHYVSVSQVFSNWQFESGVFSQYAFLESAIVNTEFMTQMMLFGMVFILALFVRDALFEKRRLGPLGKAFVRA